MRNLVLLLCWVLLGAGMLSPAMADEASHRASAERFLRLANAEGMTAPVYAQVSRLINAQFSQLGGSLQYEAVRLARACGPAHAAWWAAPPSHPSFLW